MLHDREWVEAYISGVLQWPKRCTLSTRDRQLIGLAKALAYSWEPGILNHTDLALNSGAKAEEVTEVLRATAVCIGLADLDRGTRGMPYGSAGKDVRDLLRPVREYFGSLPKLFRRKVLLQDREWLRTLLLVSAPAYDSDAAVIPPRLRALVCLAGAAVLGWDDGVKRYSSAAIKFGAGQGEISDVVRSVFKTAVSNAMAAGFRTPCHIPRLGRYRTILSAYVAAGALAERGTEPLEARASSQ